ncbi:hypothetical protein JQN58_01605 [Aneurinibacillus sp. BA2021]|nr:hypothetical protein [Aneurinibacillus sp. BA2021]
MMYNLDEEKGISVYLEKPLIEKIKEFKCFNQQTYLDFNKESDLKFGVEEKLYTILRYANDFIEMAKREVEGLFTTEEALLLFVCLVGEDIRLDCRKPGRELMLLIYKNRKVLEKFYKSLPRDTIEQISKKADSLTSSQFMGLKVMAIELRHKSNGCILRFSSNDISSYFRTAVGSDTTESWYDIEI